MSEGGNPIGALLSFWMFLQLVAVLTALAGGLYALWCLSRMASGVNRLADSIETLTAQQLAAQQNVSSNLPTSQMQISNPQMPQAQTPHAQPFVPTNAPYAGNAADSAAPNLNNANFANANSAHAAGAIPPLFDVATNATSAIPDAVVPDSATSSTRNPADLTDFDLHPRNDSF